MPTIAELNNMKLLLVSDECTLCNSHWIYWNPWVSHGALGFRGRPFGNHCHGSERIFHEQQELKHKVRRHTLHVRDELVASRCGSHHNDCNMIQCYSVTQTKATWAKCDLFVFWFLILVFVSSFSHGKPSMMSFTHYSRLHYSKSLNDWRYWIVPNSFSIGRRWECQCDQHSHRRSIENDFGTTHASSSQYECWRALIHSIAEKLMSHVDNNHPMGNISLRWDWQKTKIRRANVRKRWESGENIWKLR